jgi:hypothetical protein
MNLLLLGQAPAPLQDAGFWSNALSGIEAEHRFVLLLVGIGCGTGVVLGTIGIISGAIKSIYRRRAEMDLKREMIERGLSADEITKVIEAATPLDDATQRWIASWAKKKTG